MSAERSAASPTSASDSMLTFPSYSTKVRRVAQVCTMLPGNTRFLLALPFTLHYSPVEYPDGFRPTCGCALGSFNLYHSNCRWLSSTSAFRLSVLTVDADIVRHDPLARRAAMLHSEGSGAPQKAPQPLEHQPYSTAALCFAPPAIAAGSAAPLTSDSQYL